MSAPIPGPRRRRVPLAALLATAALLLVPLPGRWRGGWEAALLDFGHVPLFAALVWALTRPGRPLVWPVAAAVGIAGAAEVVQPLTGRTASLADLVRGTLGALAAASLVLARRRRRPAPAAGLVLLALALLAWPVLDAAPRLVDAVEGARAFPVLAGFRTDRELLRWQATQATLARRAGEPAARATFHPGPEPYPSVGLEPVRRDFRGYRRLCCAFDVEGDPLEVVVSVRTAGGDGGHTTHAQVGRVYPAGPHTVALDLPALAATARPPLDLSDVRVVQLFTASPAAPRSVVLRRVWVEP